MDADTLWMIALHEAGHAMVAQRLLRPLGWKVRQPWVSLEGRDGIHGKSPITLPPGEATIQPAHRQPYLVHLAAGGSVDRMAMHPSGDATDIRMAREIGCGPAEWRRAWQQADRLVVTLQDEIQRVAQEIWGSAVRERERVG